MDALKEEWRKPSSYFSGAPRDGWPEVEFVRVIEAGELDHSSDSM